MNIIQCNSVLVEKNISFAYSEAPAIFRRVDELFAKAVAEADKIIHSTLIVRDEIMQFSQLNAWMASMLYKVGEMCN